MRPPIFSPHPCCTHSWSGCGEVLDQLYWRLMMLWTSITCGSPGSIPTSARTGMRCSPKASNCSRESQISLTLRSPSTRKQTW